MVQESVAANLIDQQIALDLRPVGRKDRSYISRNQRLLAFAAAVRQILIHCRQAGEIVLSQHVRRRLMQERQIELPPAMVHIRGQEGRTEFSAEDPVFVGLGRRRVAGMKALRDG